MKRRKPHDFYIRQVALLARLSQKRTAELLSSATWMPPDPVALIEAEIERRLERSGEQFYYSIKNGRITSHLGAA